jgi:polyisoprenoid-binding protein YceI
MEEGETETGDFDTAKRIEFLADINSKDTDNEQRDNHLKSTSSFNAEEHVGQGFFGKKYAG